MRGFKASLVPLAWIVALPAAGDALSDLRSVLQRFPAKAPFTASAAVHVNSDSKDVAGARGGGTTFEADFGPGGLTLRVPPGALGAAEVEAAQKKRNAENLTPTRTAMVSLTIFDIIDALDAAAMLLNDLDGATLVAQVSATHAGKPATLLRIKVKSTLAGTRSRFVNEPRIELRIWVDASGLPLAAERDSSYSAAVLFFKAENVRKEYWDLAVAGDRLYAATNEQDDRVSAVGKSIVNSRSVTYAPK